MILIVIFEPYLTLPNLKTYGLIASTACDVDPLVFQTYKSLMCFTSSFVVLLLGIEFSFTPWGIVSGFFWVCLTIVSQIERKRFLIFFAI